MFQSQIKEQQNADLLLLLESGEDAAKGVLTGKIFEYMISGKPVLSLGSKKDSAIGLMIEKTVSVLFVKTTQKKLN